jgi:hypothetical protein
MIEEMLGEDNFIVAADDFLNVAIAWNGGSTFNVWSQRSETDWGCCDMFTFIGVKNAYHAKYLAREWIARQYEEMENRFNHMNEAA